MEWILPFHAGYPHENVLFTGYAIALRALYERKGRNVRDARSAVLYLWRVF